MAKAESNVRINKMEFMSVIAVTALSLTANGQCSPWIGGTGLSVASTPNVNMVVEWDRDGAGPLPSVLVLGGTFRFAPSATNVNFAIWDGLTVANTTGEFIDRPPSALGTFQNVLYAATNDGTVPANRLLKSTDGVTWVQVISPMLGGVSGEISVIREYAGSLYVGGNFSAIGGVTARNIARYDGTNWHAVSTGTNTSGAVRAFCEWNGKLIVGGVFSSIGGVSTSNIASWDGTSFSAVGTGLQLGFEVSTLTLFAGDLVAGGSGNSNARVAAVATASSAWRLVGSLPSTGAGSVNSLVSNGSELIAIGNFTGLGSATTALRIAVCDASYSWSPLGSGNNNAGFAGTVFRGETIIAGAFTSVNGIAATGWARHSLTGIPWLATQPVGITSPSPASGVASFNVASATGYSPTGYLWKRNGSTVSNGANGASSGGGTVSGATTNTLSISATTFCDRGSYTCDVSTSCGATVSSSASLSFPCQADLNGDLQVDDSDFVIFLTSYDLLVCSDPAIVLCCQADLNGDELVDDSDFALFVVAYDALLC